MNSDSSSKSITYDVIVIGGGPAGSTAASWLAKSGKSVLVLEREKFPRFHIGESLIPNANRVLKEIGVWDKVIAADFVKKYGAQFTVPDRSIQVRSEFADGIVSGMEQTYQVERSRFDDILLKHARSLGAEVLEEARVRKVAKSDSVWVVEVENFGSADSRLFRANWVIDASGRSSVMGKQLKISKEVIPYPGRFSVFNHFENVPRPEGKRAGDVVILRLEDAWFWLIPISEKVTSVGVVAQKGARSGNRESLGSFFWRKVKQSSWLSDQLSRANSIEDYRIDSDYCFSYESFGKDKVLLAGDAASFIDPVFSSGVYLALESGLLAAKAVESSINQTEIDLNCIYNSYTVELKKQVAVMRKLIESFYNDESFEIFMTPKPKLRIPAAVNSILAGCLNPPFAVKWRFWIFLKLCELQKKWPLVPRISWELFESKNEK